jgi:hypothetical protein
MQCISLEVRGETSILQEVGGSNGGGRMITAKNTDPERRRR